MNRKLLLSMVLAAATLSAHADGDDWLHTDGRRILDEQNQEVKLTGDITGIAHVQKTGHAYEVARYDVTGLKVSKGTPGMVIVKMSDGIYKKVFVKY